MAVLFVSVIHFLMAVADKACAQFVYAFCL